MGIMETIVAQFMEDINALLDNLALLVLLSALVLADLYILVKWFKDKGVGKTLYLWFLLVFGVEGVPLLIFAVSQQTLRWIELFTVIPTIIYLLTRKHGRRRGLYSAFGHLAVLFIGWAIGRWFGLLLFSFPMVTLYYYFLYRLAAVVIPVSNADDSREMWDQFSKEWHKFFYSLQAWKRFFYRESWYCFLVLCWYSWGFQHPMWVAEDTAGRKIGNPITGDQFRKIGAPGLIWARAHHAIGITAGTQFTRVEGPGVVFTRPFERPQEIVDLRTQLRTAEIEAVTQDGIAIKAILFTAFAVDREPHTLGDLHRLFPRDEQAREDWNTFINTVSSYPFSPARVRAGLRMTGVGSSLSDPILFPVHWDDMVMHRASEIARQVLTERRLDELWRPVPDMKGASVLEQIASSINRRIAQNLREIGVNLFTARIVNFDFMNKEDNPVLRQKIANWSAYWEQQAVRTLAEGEAAGERLQLEARAFAHSALLTAVAEGLQRTGSLYPNLPRYVIAMRFVAAIEELIHQRPEVYESLSGEIQSRFKDWKKRFQSPT